MKKLLATTALVVGIGLSAQASDPNATLEQITEIVAGHYLEEIENLQESHANRVENIYQNWTSTLNYFSQDSGTGVEVTNISGLVDSIVNHVTLNYEPRIVELEAENADLNEIANILDVELNEAQGIIAALETINTEQRNQIDAVWDAMNYFGSPDRASIYPDTWAAVENAFNWGKQIVEDQVAHEWAEIQEIRDTEAERHQAHRDQINELQEEIAAANAATEAAQAEAQEASNRANVNAQNATAWYEEAQRLQALLDEQD